MEAVQLLATPTDKEGSGGLKVKTKNGATPLHWAAAKGHVEWHSCWFLSRRVPRRRTTQTTTRTRLQGGSDGRSSSANKTREEQGGSCTTAEEMTPSMLHQRSCTAP